jgi:molybdenum-dependent DNA-binding transcriptional regulator ModE
MLIIKPRSFSILVVGREVEIGSRVIEILRIVKMRGTIKATSEELGVSYRGDIGAIRGLRRSSVRS